MARSYNNIYNLIIEDENDIIGHIAYSLYKSDKIAYIEDFRENNGRDPEEKDLDEFHRISSIPANIERLKMHAASVINDVIFENIRDIEKEVEDKAYRASKQTLSEIIEPLKPKSFWSNLGENVFFSLIGSIIWVILFSLLIFALSAKNNGVSLTIGADGETKIEHLNR